MCPIAETDGHDRPGLIDEAVPCGTAMIEDILVGSEDAVGEPVFTHELPDVLGGVQLGGAGRERHQGDVVGDLEGIGRMPAGLIEEHHGMGVGGDGRGDLGEVRGHGGGVAAGHDDRRALSLLRADGAEDVGRGGALVLRRRGSGSAPRPSPSNPVFLADPGLILEPDLYSFALGNAVGDLRQRGGEVFLNVSRASGSCP